MHGKSPGFPPSAAAPTHAPACESESARRLFRGQVLPIRTAGVGRSRGGRDALVSAARLWSSPRPMPRLTRILLALLLLAMPLAARASDALRLSAQEARAGDAITIEWSRLPAGTDEVELELALDGGRWLRISPELEAHEGRFVWRVPAGLVGDARVRLRYGLGNEEHEGAIVSLTLSATGDAASPNMSRAAGEWWNVGEHDAPGAPTGFSGGASLAPTLATLTGVLNDPSFETLVPLDDPRFTARAPARSTLAPPARRFTAPRNAPLRN